VQKIFAAPSGAAKAKTTQTASLTLYRYSPFSGTKNGVHLKEAYGDALKKRLDVFFDACIDNHQEAEARFVTGLRILRDARDRALELV